MIRKYLLTSAILIFCFLFSATLPHKALAQMPVTQAKVDACLAAGSTAQECLTEALNYLNNECGLACEGPNGEKSTGYCSGSLCYITCGNGSTMTFPNDAPQCPSATNVCADTCYNGENTAGSPACAANPALYGGSKCCSKPNNPPASACPDNPYGPTGGKNTCRIGSSCPAGETPYGSTTNNACGVGKVCCFAAPTSAPSPSTPPSGPVCGNTSCEAGESCSTCPADCGSCANPPTATPRPTATPKATATPTPPPACNVRCDNRPSGYCAGGTNRTDNCTVCATDPTNPSQKTCQPPPPTATATPIPACNAPCTSSTYCQGATDGCTYCNPTTNTCQPPNSPTPTATATPRPTATSTPTPTSTPSPTPLPFDTSMCKCNGLNFGRIALGTPVKVTAFGVVNGVNTSYAKIPSFTFKFYQGNGTVVNQIKKETVPTIQILDTPQQAKYQADWTLDLPLTLDTTQTYRIQAVPDCSRKTAALYNAYPTTAVLATETTKPQGLWDRIVSFFLNIFGGGQQNVQNIAGPTATPTLTAEQRKQLQLKTFTPAQGVSTDNCSFIKFSF